jgi:hypothetical protein
VVKFEIQEFGYPGLTIEFELHNPYVWYTRPKEEPNSNPNVITVDFLTSTYTLSSGSILEFSESDKLVFVAFYKAHKEAIADYILLNQP